MKSRLAVFALLALFAVVGAAPVGVGQPAAAARAAAGEPPGIVRLASALMFESDEADPNRRFILPRDMTVDQSGNLFVFDYADNTIRKYDPSGRHVVTFGGRGGVPGTFMHLMGLEAIGNRLCALDSTGGAMFTLDGALVEQRPFAKEVICQYPRISAVGRFAGTTYLMRQLKKALTLRACDGTEIARIAEYDLREFFPDLKAGGDYYVSDDQARFYVYDFRPDGSLVWAASDAGVIYEYGEGGSRALFSVQLTPVAVPDDRIRAQERRRAGSEAANPRLKVYVPRHYQVVQHLLALPDGDLLVYLLSQEMTGLARFSPQGELRALAKTDPCVDMTRALVRRYGDQLYLFSPKGTALKIHRAGIPAAARP